MTHKPTSAEQSGARGSRQGIRGVLGRLSVVALVLGIVSLVYLDRFVQDRFLSHQWEAPARVYGAPLTLQPDRRQTRDDILWWLDRLGYQRVGQVQGPGEYRPSEEQLILHTRGFPFWGQKEPPRRLLLGFRSDELVRLRTAAGGNIGQARLEPPTLGHIDTQFAEDRILVELDQVPRTLLAGLLAVEDKRFFQHHGVSLPAIARALWVNVRAGRVEQGGSTLTQQLVKNLFLSSDQSLLRKGVEAAMAVMLERRVSKEAILEAYVNEVFVAQAGRRAVHGFGLAARHFYGRPISELSIAQQAMLIGLLRGPSYYSPSRHPDRARTRRNVVLAVMHDEGIISAAERRTAMREGLRLNPSTGAGPYAHALDLVRRQLRVWLNNREMQREDLRVHTTIDIRAQDRAQRLMTRHLKNLESRYDLNAGALQGALVAADTRSGRVRAVSGGRLQQVGGFNRALDAFRPVGSTLKPVIYLTALESGLHWWSAVDDLPLVVRGKDGSEWRPENFDQQSHGSVPMWEAMARSYNQAAARTGMQIGLGRYLSRLESLGFRGDLPVVPAALLGAVEMSPYQLASLFQPMLSGGERQPLMILTAATTAEGALLARFDTRSQRVIAPEDGQSLLSGLRLVGSAGTARSGTASLRPTLSPAGKTGTSDGQRDSWFVGSAGNTMAAVWVGADDNRELPLTGSTGALPLWAEWIAQVARPQTGNTDMAPSLRWVSWNGEAGSPGSVFLGPCGRYRAAVPVSAVSALVDQACRDNPVLPKTRESNGGLGDWFRAWF